MSGPGKRMGKGKKKGRGHKGWETKQKRCTPVQIKLRDNKVSEMWGKKRQKNGNVQLRNLAKTKQKGKWLRY